MTLFCLRNSLKAWHNGENRLKLGIMARLILKIYGVSCQKIFEMWTLNKVQTHLELLAIFCRGMKVATMVIYGVVFSAATSSTNSKKRVLWTPKLAWNTVKRSLHQVVQEIQSTVWNYFWAVNLIIKHFWNKMVLNDEKN